VHEYSSSDLDTFRPVRAWTPAVSRPVPIGVWRCRARISRNTWSPGLFPMCHQSLLKERAEHGEKGW